MRFRIPISRWAAACAVLLFAHAVQAHGIVGNRFFPPTITTEDPFAVDELSLPAVSIFKTPGDEDGPETRQIDASYEFSKEIFPKFAVSVSQTYSFLKPRGGKQVGGWQNLELGAKYELWRSDPQHEMIISLGLESEIGNTGSEHLGVESSSEFTPTIYFGKGFGDLPDSMEMLKPIAVTGSIGQSFNTSAAEPNTLEWGFAVEYSIPYLQQHIKDMGIPAPFRDMIPVVEFSFETTENRGPSLTTGTINPGVLWECGSVQLGAEALIPVNRRSGRHVGAIVELHFYIDDLMPKLFGGPIFGGD